MAGDEKTPAQASEDQDLNDALEDTFPASDPVSITRVAKGKRAVDGSTAGDGDADDAASEDEITTAEEIGFASEAGNR
ncbi:MAG: hypothetical protein K2P80_04635 [Beijerinckiaceae bacterium]|nr:hypothetical protein [Beijerinckiaceae bacterium]